jgi:hypothetical protein
MRTDTQHILRIKMALAKMRIATNLLKEARRELQQAVDAAAPKRPEPPTGGESVRVA